MLSAGQTAKKEATRADRGLIPRVRSRFDSSVYGSANCCRTTRFGSIIARWFQTLPARRSGGAKKEAATAYRGTIPRANRRFIASIALSAASFPLPDPADLIPPLRAYEIDSKALKSQVPPDGRFSRIWTIQGIWEAPRGREPCFSFTARRVAPLGARQSLVR